MDKSSNASLSLVEVPTESPESKFTKWASSMNIESNIEPAFFMEGTNKLRGAKSTACLRPGDDVIKIPQEMLISIHTALKSEIGDIISHVAQQAGDDFAILIWILWSRQIVDSDLNNLWAVLPKSFETGLSLQEDLQTDESLPLHLDLKAAKQHLCQQYEIYFKPLVIALQPFIGDAGFEWQDFLWASELWYSYAVEVVDQGAGDKQASFTCLVPTLFFCNHSIHPHVVYYSSIDNGYLTAKTCRSVEKDEPVFLSYGPLSNNKLITFYGFSLDVNPYDRFEISLDPEEICLNTNSDLYMQKVNALETFDIKLEHMFKEGNVSPKLLALLKILLANEQELEELERRSPSEIAFNLHLSKENDISALESLMEIVVNLKEMFSGPPKLEKHTKLSTMMTCYVKSMQSILDSVIASCKDGLSSY